jgi:hypothetical protein
MPSLLQAQAPNIQWQRCIGGTGGDVASSIIQTFDGGLAVAGYTNSTDGDIAGKHGGIDALIIKLNSSGSIEWQKCFGGDSDDVANCIIQTPDSGFIIAGWTFSKEGDANGNHGAQDALIIKVNSAGKILWQHCFGGEGYDEAISIIRTHDGGYIFSGGCGSQEEGFPNHGPSDVWVVKIDSSGNLQWQKLLGGTGGGEYGISIIQATNGDFLIAGETNSMDGDEVGNRGYHLSAWILRLSLSGNIKWQRCFTGDQDSRARSIINTSDGGFAVAGETYCALNCGADFLDFPGTRGSMDVFVIKFNTLDSVEWIKTYGGINFEIPGAIIQTSDGGFVFAGNTDSKDGDVSGKHGGYPPFDAWLVKLGSLGNIEWQKCLGGQGDDIGYSVIQTSDKGYAIVGYTGSNDGDVSGNHGSDDAWIVKLMPEANVVEAGQPADENIFLSPNPGSGIEKISYDLAIPSLVKIEVFNPLGMELRLFTYSKEEAGKHEHDFDISDLTPGSYFLRIDMGGKSEMRAIELLK